MSRVTNIVISALLTCIGSACSTTTQQHSDTPTSGHIIIAADESLQPIVNAQVGAFTGIYKNASIDVLYTSEENAIQLLLRDSVRLVVVARPLVADEHAVLEADRLKAHSLIVAHSAIALATNKKTADNTITLQALKHLLADSLEEELSFRKLIFDQANTAIMNDLQAVTLTDKISSRNCFFVSGAKEVLRYVTEHEHAIGLIDVSWVSDSDDSTALLMRQSVKVLEVANGDAFYGPHQAYIAQNQYPLIRNVYMISREARAGLASGFIAFVASEKGQRVVLKSGLVPATMPLRVVQINHKQIK